MPRASMLRWCAAAALLCFAALRPLLSGDFVNWDDPVNLLGNPHFRGLGGAQLRWMWTTFHMGHYQPLSWMSLGLDYLVWGMHPFGYKLTNLLLHSANAVWVLLIARTLLARALPRVTAGRLSWAALAAALMFAVHPLRVESVAWATERRDVLSAFFYLAALYAYLRAAGMRGRAAVWRRASVGLFAASLLSKAQGVHLPVVLAVLNLYPLRRRRFWGELAPFAALAVCFSLLAVVGGSSAGKLLSLQEFGPLQRLAQLCFAFVFYLVKTLYPAGLAPLYARPEPLSPFDGPFLGSMLAVLVMTVLCLLARRRRPALLAAWTAYTLMLLPVSGLFPNGPQLVADRYTYLACLPLPLLLAGGWLILCGRALRAGAAAAGVAALVLWAAAARAYIPVWGNSRALWRRAFRASPASTLAQTNLSGTYHNFAVRAAERGDAALAKRAYRQALRVYPAAWASHYNLGMLLLREGDAEKAALHFRYVLRVAPNHHGARAALARTQEAGR